MLLEKVHRERYARDKRERGAGERGRIWVSARCLCSYELKLRKRQHRAANSATPNSPILSSCRGCYGSYTCRLALMAIHNFFFSRQWVRQYRTSRIILIATYIRMRNILYYILHLFLPKYIILNNLTKFKMQKTSVTRFHQSPLDEWNIAQVR